MTKTFVNIEVKNPQTAQKLCAQILLSFSIKLITKPSQGTYLVM